ncbi:MAG: DinB family protein [Clostridia bacterium]|nr:DinB family protein [Clostridia bacterium]
MPQSKMIHIVKRHFEFSFSMLEKMIDQCPEDLWGAKNGGFVFWQQLVHAFTGLHFWMRRENNGFSEPFSDKKVFPELDGEPDCFLSKEEVAVYKDAVKKIWQQFFEGREDDWLLLESVIYGKITNMDVVFMQIRHMQYHAGHCNSILRDKGREAVAWVDYLAE